MMQPIQQQLQQHLQHHQQMQQQHLQQQQHQQMQQQQQQQHHHRHLEKGNSVSAQTDDNIGSITSTAGKRSGGDCSSMRERRQSTASRHYDSGSQTPTARPKYSSSHRNSSTNISTSQSELSNMCPHSKPSTPAVIKSKFSARLL